MSIASILNPVPSDVSGEALTIRRPIARVPIVSETRRLPQLSVRPNPVAVNGSSCSSGHAGQAAPSSLPYFLSAPQSSNSLFNVMLPTSMSASPMSAPSASFYSPYIGSLPIVHSSQAPISYPPISAGPPFVNFGVPMASSIAPPLPALFSKVPDSAPQHHLATSVAALPSFEPPASKSAAPQAAEEVAARKADDLDTLPYAERQRLAQKWWGSCCSTKWAHSFCPWTGCYEKFNPTDEPAYHVVRHLRLSYLSCPFCNYKQERNVSKHKIVSHIQRHLAPMFRCSCGRRYSQKQSYAKHVRLMKCTSPSDS